MECDRSRLRERGKALAALLHLVEVELNSEWVDDPSIAFDGVHRSLRNHSLGVYRLKCHFGELTNNHLRITNAQTIYYMITAQRAIERSRRAKAEKGEISRGTCVRQPLLMFLRYPRAADPRGKIADNGTSSDSNINGNFNYRTINSSR
uniref:Uncharacterized protein n=1 Tax=Branchiostoma floridae TaxID=7739 RepID=C3YKY2_BRAFL|eukprot:XP_002602961.1 hypothetical protein BRAFLDRAFT_105862 [Branchiostoma floridae]